MKSVTLSGSLRANVGKTDSTALRNNGRVPCVIYGEGEQIHFSADIRHFKNIIFTPETNLVNIEIDGKTHQTILQEGTQATLVDKMQTREALYDVLGYRAYEESLDNIDLERKNGR